MASLALFGQAQGSAELPALPYVAQELQAVSAIGKARHVRSETYLDARFTAAALEHAIQHDSVVHIASHFVLRPGQNDDSYLLLGNGDKLSVAEFAQARFHFSGLDLLTLSACETAVPAGTDASGRELSSLAWLARERGARYVLASLWRVSDRSTAALMADFYSALERGASKTEALHRAQLRQINRLTASKAASTRGLKAIDVSVANRLYGHPFYWAGFILLGS
jgi:CHAT domain-containing protein